MAFKMVTDSEKAAGRIAGTALAHAEMIAGEQTAKWRHRLPAGQTVIDVEQLQRFHAEELLRLRQELRDKEAAHLDRLEEIREARERRDAVVPRLRGRLYAMRDLFQGVYGPRGPRALFAGKPTVPADATPLRRVGRMVAEKLLDEDLELPEAILEGTELTHRTLAGQISEPLAELETAMKELEDLLPLASASLEAKKKAHAAADEKSAVLARFLEGLYGLEGHDVLAAKVRPSSHGSKKEKAGAAVENVREITEAELPPAAETAESGGGTEAAAATSGAMPEPGSHGVLAKPPASNRRGPGPIGTEVRSLRFQPQVGANQNPAPRRGARIPERRS